MKKTISLLLSGLLACGAVASFAGCGQTSYPEDAVVIYKEYNGLSGNEDDKVKEAIEKKFEQDTGESISLFVEPHATNMLGSKVTGAISAGERLDAVVTHYSSDSFLTTMVTEEEELKDLTQLLPEYAPNYLARFNETTDPGSLAYNKGIFNGKIYSLSSLEHTSIFGMLVNKTHMALTDFDPDEYDIANGGGYKSLTISEFKELLVQLKERVGDGKNRPLGGAPYDIEYFLNPVFESSGYTHMELIGDRLYPAWATENYCKVLEFERALQEERLWTDHPLSAANIDGEFTKGYVSVYTPYPEVTQQIETARNLKKATGDDCIMLAPLRADGEEISRGNARHESSFLGLAALRGGENTELLLKYVNWLSIKENYELAKYGIEGEHWEKVTLANGAEGYAYPEAKRTQYEEHLPYSGVYCLLTDVNLSNRTYAGYSDAEAKWVEEVHAFPCYPAQGYDDEGIIMPSVPVTDRALSLSQTKMSNEYVNVRGYAWSDAPLGENTIAGLHSDLVAKFEDAAVYKPYIDFLTTEFNKIKENFIRK